MLSLYDLREELAKNCYDPQCVIDTVDFYQHKSGDYFLRDRLSHYVVKNGQVYYKDTDGTLIPEEFEDFLYEIIETVDAEIADEELGFNVNKAFSAFE